MAVADVMKMVKENDIKFVDFRFTDTKEKNSTLPYLFQPSTKKNFPKAMPLMAPPSPAGKASRRPTCC